MKLSFLRIPLASIISFLKTGYCQEAGGCRDCTSVEFCGIDKLCHSYTCENYFRLGGWNAIEIGNKTLACEDYGTGGSNGNYAVVFACTGYGPRTVIEGDGFGQAFNRKCSATIGQQLFECYDLKPDTDFTPFLSQVEASTPQTCPENYIDGVQEFIYQINVGEESEGGYSGGFTGFYGPDGTTTFDASLTKTTMSALVTNLTMAPTEIPGTSGSRSNVFGQGVLFVVVSFVSTVNAFLL